MVNAPWELIILKYLLDSSWVSKKSNPLKTSKAVKIPARDFSSGLKGSGKAVFR